jgi:MoxR-like ATPase
MAATVELSKTDYELRTKIRKYLQVCRQIVIGRDKEINLAGMGFIARANIMLLGTPGEGKSYLASTMLDNLIDAKTFFTACSPETDMDAIFGTPIFQELQHGKMVRNLEGSLADCDIAFIDEIGKANDALHKSMFTALNERVFVNGTAGTVKLPLISTIAASNEALSLDTAGLNSRFHLKAICNRLDNEQRFELLSRRNNATKLIFPDELKISVDDIRNANNYVKAIRLNEQLLRKIIAIAHILDMSSQPDSRKLELSVDLVKASCWLRMKTEPTIEDLNVLKYSLWDAPEHAPEVESVINDYLQS